MALSGLLIFPFLYVQGKFVVPRQCPYLFAVVGVDAATEEYRSGSGG